MTPSRLQRRAAVKKLIFMTDETRLKNPEAVMQRLPEGSIVIFRDYDHPARYDRAGKLARLANHLRLQFFVAGDLDLARAVKADGLHLPEHMLTDACTIQRARMSGLRLSAACHSRRSLMWASKQRVDMALVSPVFKTGSHLGAPVLGVHRLARLIKGVDPKVALIGLGGINHDTGAALKGLNLSGIAGITGLV